MTQKAPFTPRRKRRDLLTLVVAGALLAGVGLWWTLLSRQVVAEKKEILAHVPAFPKRGQPPRPTREDSASPKPVVAVAPAAALDGGAAPPPLAPSVPTLVKQFLLNADPKGIVTNVHLNALMNAPFIDRLDKCFPKDRLAGEDGGVDFARDIDQIAGTDEGLVFTGFFDEAGALAVSACPDAQEQGSYKGFRLYSCGKDVRWSVAVQPSMALRALGEGPIEALVDQALSPPPAGASADDIYGDVYMRMGSTPESGPEPTRSEDAFDRLLGAAFSAAESLTVRANVWDSVALTLEARPREGRSAEDLALTTNAALAVVRRSIDPEDVELSAYAELAQVTAVDGQMLTNLALPTEKLVEQMNAMCERDQARRQRRQQRASGESGEEAEVEEAAPELPSGE